MHLGRPHVIGAWAIGDSIVDPGPESCLETLLAGLEVPPKRLLLTHIHFDHAGASGALVERFPDLEVCVHERGAAHMIDPERLTSSASRLYGDRMEELWGRIVPVPEANVTVLYGGETLAGDVAVHYTPGHASHHVTYLVDRVAYTGDVGGVLIGDTGVVVMPTPPPDIDVELWEGSIDLIESLRPERLRVTHFGEVTGDSAGHLETARRRLRRSAELARELDLESFVERMRSEMRAEAPEEAEAYLQATPPDQLWRGLDRYWTKKAEKERDEA